MPLNTVRCRPRAGNRDSWTPRPTRTVSSAQPPGEGGRHVLLQSVMPSLLGDRSDACCDAHAAQLSGRPTRLLPDGSTTRGPGHRDVCRARPSEEGTPHLGACWGALRTSVRARWAGGEKGAMQGAATGPGGAGSLTLTRLNSWQSLWVHEKGSASSWRLVGSALPS